MERRAPENGSLRKYISVESDLELDRNGGFVVLEQEVETPPTRDPRMESRALYRRRSIILGLVQTMCGVIVLTFDLLQYTDIPSSIIWSKPYHAFWVVPFCLLSGLSTFLAAIIQHKITYTFCTVTCLVASVFALTACILNMIKMFQIYEQYIPAYKAKDNHEQFVLEMAILAVRLFIILLELVAALVQAAFHPLTCCPLRKRASRYPPYEDSAEAEAPEQEHEVLAAAHN